MGDPTNCGKPFCPLNQPQKGVAYKKTTPPSHRQPSFSRVIPAHLRAFAHPRAPGMWRARLGGGGWPLEPQATGADTSCRHSPDEVGSASSSRGAHTGPRGSSARVTWRVLLRRPLFSFFFFRGTPTHVWRIFDIDPTHLDKGTRPIVPCAPRGL